VADLAVEEVSVGLVVDQVAVVVQAEGGKIYLNRNFKN
jgi:hypothetical protein